MRTSVSASVPSSSREHKLLERGGSPGRGGSRNVRVRTRPTLPRAVRGGRDREGRDVKGGRGSKAAQEQLVVPDEGVGGRSSRGVRGLCGGEGGSRCSWSYHHRRRRRPPCTMLEELKQCERVWEELELEFHELQDTHKVYRQKLEELTTLQTTCNSSIKKQKKRLNELQNSLQRCKLSANSGETNLIQQMSASIKERHNVFFNMEAYLPKENGLYLSLVLGNVNVTLLSNQAKFAYKDEYEKFKLYLTIIFLFGAIACRFFLNYRVTDEVFNFMLVWYYCTLTIRESILISNGSRIKGWWVSHHYVSTFLSGIMLTWPDGLIYQKFRSQFLAFSIFQSCVQFLQYYYQSGCLYRLRALGERNHLDLTVEGFQSWMWRGLTFLLPILFCGHFWQLYNAITLFELSTHEECKEWQVFVLAITFLILFLGNFLTTLKVVHAKLQKNRDKMKL
ncbi:transmembrane protein 120B isoform X1 [Monodelphis domestica]|uniref:transmembrane protein 120B isoform X1 n=1 Tax=Monodelphis domestica TaxID=13616 RepID=UPI0024E1E2ED|nr:transmembrane protein 120B isoform X1 [Monodelphis domestica]